MPISCLRRDVRRTSHRRLWALFVLVALSPLSPVHPAFADDSTPTPDAERATPTSEPIRVEIPTSLQKIFAGETPQDLKSLKAMDEHFQTLVEKVSKATVAVKVRGAQGSGVIIRPDGLLLTAGHVTGGRNRAAYVTLSDGRLVRARTLGVDFELDTALMQITEPGVYPYVECSDDGRPKIGLWCLALGHPGGYREGRPAPARLGRVNRYRNAAITTDCALVGGDSGGPLFDMAGRVIGIHSRIGPSVAGNLHVPIARYTESLDALEEEAVFGDPNGPFIGFRRKGDTRERVIVDQVIPGTAAQKCGLKTGDVITRIDRREVTNWASLRGATSRLRVGREVELVVERAGESVTLLCTPTKRGDR